MEDINIMPKKESLLEKIGIYTIVTLFIVPLVVVLAVLVALYWGWAMLTVWNMFGLDKFYPFTYAQMVGLDLFGNIIRYSSPKAQEKDWKKNLGNFIGAALGPVMIVLIAKIVLVFV